MSSSAWDRLARAEAWLWTGPVGRVVAFFGDLGSALLASLRERRH